MSRGQLENLRNSRGHRDYRDSHDNRDYRDHHDSRRFDWTQRKNDPNTMYNHTGVSGQYEDRNEHYNRYSSLSDLVD